jgi:hypothetical protein
MTAFLGEFGAVLGNVALHSIVILVLVAMPVLAVRAVVVGVSLVLDTLGRW